MNYSDLVELPVIPASKPIIDLSPQVMSPELEEWKSEKFKSIGEIIVPKVVEYEDDDCLVWIRRVGSAATASLEYDYCQIGCSHLPMLEADGDDGLLLYCKSLQKAINRRAQAVDEAFGHSDTLIYKTLYNPEHDRLHLSSSGKEVAEQYVLNMLDHTIQHPSVWLANHISGEHNIFGLAMLMRLEPGEVMGICKKLEEKGQLTFKSDNTVALSDSYRDFLENFSDQGL